MKRNILILAIIILGIIFPDYTYATQKVNNKVSESVISSETFINETVFWEDNYMEPPYVPKATAALLIDMNSGRLLYGKNINKRIFPASTTKIMTGILAIEMGNLDETVTVTTKAIETITIYDSQIGLLVGEKLTLEQLLNAMLIPSANDAANVIAVHIASSINSFAEIMNQKAKELGMNNTHFENACGMHHENHYTTANDLSVLAQYAMKNETFREIVKKATYKLPPTNKCDSERILRSTNLFLSSVFHYNPLCTGIKTGRTSKAGYCLVSSSQNKDINLLSVVMGCPNEDTEANAYSYTYSKALYDFGFNNYTNKVVASPGDVICTSKVYEAKNGTPLTLTVDNKIDALVPSYTFTSEEIETQINLPEQILAPITKGSILGTVTYSYKGTILGTSHLIAANDVERSIFIYIIHKVSKILFNPFFFIPVIIIAIIISNHNRKKRIRQRCLERQKKRNAERVIQSDFLTTNPKNK